MSTSKSYWFCYAVDLRTKLRHFPSYHTRDSLSFSAPMLRHSTLRCGDDFLVVCQAGLLILLQKIAAPNEQEHARIYSDEAAYGLYDARAQALLRQFTHSIREDILVVFPVVTGASSLQVDWKFVSLPATDIALHLFFEATAIDHLCRVIEKMAVGLLAEKTLIEQRTLIEYVEGLREVARPTSFLVNASEIESMEKFYAAWNLTERVENIRQTFSDSIASSTLYTGQLDRNGQDAMGFFLAGIAILSLAQVSKPMTEWLGTSGVALTEPAFNSSVAITGITFIGWGLLRYLLLPRIGLVLARLRDYGVGRVILFKLNRNSRY